MGEDQFELAIARRFARRDLCSSMHEAGHVMLADALGVGIERVWITGLYDATINPQAGVKLVSGGCALSKAIVIALAGRAVDEALDVDNTKCEVGFDQIRTDERVLQECLENAYAPDVPTA